MDWSPEAVLENYPVVRKQLMIEMKDRVVLIFFIQKLGVHCKANDWSTENLKNLLSFAKDTFDDVMYRLFFATVMSAHNEHNVKLIHQSYFALKVIEIVKLWPTE